MTNTTGFQAWFANLGCKNVTPVTVKIKGTVYKGMKYTDHRFNNVGIERVYLLGDLPTCYKRKAKTTFTFPGDPRDWYICAYMPPERFATLEDQFKPFHPFGPHFLLTAWTHNERLDHYEENKYTRVPIEEVHDV